MENKNKKILIIDDEPDGLDLILTSFGYETDVATNGKDGINKLLSNGGYNLALIDLVMPQVPGWKVLEQLRSNDKTRTLPVIIITAFNTSENQISSLNIGADDCIAKPFEIPALLARIESLLRRVNWQDNHTVTLTTNEENNNSNLTKRQVEILSLMSKGYSNKQIADKLFLSETTVKAHLRTVFRKLGVANRTQAVLAGLNKGVIS